MDGGSTSLLTGRMLIKDYSNCLFKEENNNCKNKKKCLTPLFCFLLKLPHRTSFSSQTLLLLLLLLFLLLLLLPLFVLCVRGEWQPMGGLSPLSLPDIRGEEGGGRG